MLEDLVNSGCRHFDTAPSYGLGNAESEFGRFVRAHGLESELLITSKFGRAVPSLYGSRTIRLVTPAARMIAHRLPRLVDRIRPGITGIAGEAGAEGYLFRDALDSLDLTLKNLAVPRLHAWLLHDRDIRLIPSSLWADLAAETLVMQHVGRIGVATDASFVDASHLQAVRNPVIQVLQTRAAYVSDPAWRSLMVEPRLQVTFFGVFAADLEKLGERPEARASRSGNVSTSEPVESFVVNMEILNQLVPGSRCIFTASSRKTLHGFLDTVVK